MITLGKFYDNNLHLVNGSKKYLFAYNENDNEIDSGSLSASHTVQYQNMEQALWDLARRTKYLLENPEADDADDQHEYLAALCEGLYQMEKKNPSRIENECRMNSFTLNLSKRGLNLLLNAVSNEIHRLMEKHSENRNFENAKVLHHIREDIELLLHKVDINK